MKIYTFEQTDLATTGSTETRSVLFDLMDMRTTTKYIDRMGMGIYTIPKEFEARLDLVSMDLYSIDSYVEELMIINNMMNMYSIKEGDDIYVVSLDVMESLHRDPDKNNQDTKNALINSAKDSKIDPNRNKLTPSVKADGEKQIEVDTKTKTIKIIT